MCHVAGRLGGFDVGVGSVHSQIAHASVVALVSCVPGAGASFRFLRQSSWVDFCCYCPRRRGGHWGDS